MTEQNPFVGNSARSFVLPNPGGQAAVLEPQAPAWSEELDPSAVFMGTNPLVALANPLLNMIASLRHLPHHSEPGRLREFLVGEIQSFEARAKAGAIAHENIIGARYCLCTVLDETAAQTPWGGSGIWSRHSLLVTFHNETWGGEKFFQLLSKLAGNPQLHRDLLELMYYCISLGFEGRYRIIDNGRSQLETLKRRLVDILRTVRGESERALSPHWQGITAMAPRLWCLFPVWVVAAIAALLAVGIYLWFSFHLAALSDPLFASISNLRLPRISVVAPAMTDAPPVRFGRFLEPEIREGLVLVRDLSDRSVVVLRGDGLFDSGSSQIRDRYLPVLGRIAEALNSVPGRVLVTGYTDNIPIRTARFPSNWNLSQERAESVKSALDARLSERDRVRAEGRGEADPVAPNDNTVNRARNRRVEITLLTAMGRRDAYRGETH
jgi:type VI secretion system protein ImpK